MPSVSEPQRRLMAAVAHGWQPDRIEGPPVQVARKFNRADARKRALRRRATRQDRE